MDKFLEGGVCPSLASTKVPQDSILTQNSLLDGGLSMLEAGGSSFDVPQCDSSGFFDVQTSSHISMSEEILELWQGGPGSIKASPSSFIHEDPAVQRKETRALRFWMIYMVMTGGGVDFLVGIFDDMAKKVGFESDATVFAVTAFSFLAAALPPSMAAANWKSLNDANSANPYFKYKVLVPSLADLFITFMRFAAILFVSPSVVSMLKTSTQLITLAFIQHFRGKRVNMKSGICISLCLVGQLVVSYSSMMKSDEKDDDEQQAFMVMVGLAMSITSGALGAVRNVMEEIILQTDDLTTGGLLAAESWISLLGLLVVNVGWKGVHGGLDTFGSDLCKIFAFPATWPLLFLIMVCTYGKDFGKLFVVKHGNALIAKVLGMLFPIVTWILTLTAFLVSQGEFGEGLTWPSSAVRLVGFTVIGFASISYVVTQKKKK